MARNCCGLAPVAFFRLGLSMAATASSWLNGKRQRHSPLASCGLLMPSTSSSSRHAWTDLVKAAKSPPARDVGDDGHGLDRLRQMLDHCIELMAFEKPCRA